MAQTIVELYDSRRLEQLAKKRETVRWLLAALGLGALIACVILTAGVNTRNINDRMLLCMLISIAAAWIILYFSVSVIRDGGRELAHAEHLKGEPRETVTGRLTPLKLKVQIRGSVSLRKIRVDTEDGPVTLNVHIDKAKLLPQKGETVRLYLVHGYIVAYEVIKP